MKHKSHLKQKNKQFKKIKNQKKKKSIKNIQKKKNKNDINEKYSNILQRKVQSYYSKSDQLKNEREEKAKHIPFYNCLNICLLVFHEDVDILSFKKEFIKYLCEENDEHIDIDNIKLYDIYTIHSNDKKKKKRKSFVVYDIPRDIYGIIDGTKCADVVLCLFKDGSIENSCFDELGYKLLSVLKIQGVPSIIGIGYNTNMSNKGSHKFVMRYFNSEFTMDDKIFFISENKNSDFQKLYNEITNMKIKNVSYREGRGYMMADSCAYNSENDCIYIKGFIKGVGFNYHNPIHITDVGDYYIDNIYLIDILKEKRFFDEQNLRYSFLLNPNNQQTSENEFILNFLSNNKKLPNDHTKYNYYDIKHKPIKSIFNEEDDMKCIRPYVVEDNNNIYMNNLMTLKNKDIPEFTASNFFSYDNYNINENNNSITKTMNDSTTTTNNSNNNNNNNGDNINESYTVYKYNMKNIMQDYTNDPHGNNQQYNEENTNPNINNINNMWTYISNEKHEANDDFICSYDKYGGMNDDNSSNNNNNNNNMFNNNNNNIINNFNISNETQNKKFSTNHLEYGNNDLYKNYDEDEENNDDISDDITDNITENETDNKSEDYNDDSCIEKDSNNSDNIYICKNISARERFKKYRSLQSFRTSYVDVYEDLPLEYSRIYDYESSENLIKYSRKKFVQNCKIVNGEFTLTDTYCIFVIKNDGKLLNKLNNKRNDIPVIVSSLLPFERKVTVLNMEVNRTIFYSDKVESKDIFEIICGFRHFIGCPVFSEQIIKGPQSKGKYEKHLKHGKKYVASIFGFTTVTAAPVFFIKKKMYQQMEQLQNYANAKNNNNNNNNSNNYCNNSLNSLDFQQTLGYSLDTSNDINNSLTSGRTEYIYDCITNEHNNFSNPQANVASVIVAHGKVVSCDCKRIIMKRISLCGKIFKIHKKKAVIRNMFYNPKDINYFKPVELHTKHGLTGKIVESLGTHGKMKCIFSNVLKQHDKVFIFLYKRIYPIWFPLSWGGEQDLGPDNQPLELKEKKKRHALML
ncbi:hypothetical protein PFMALIP_05349 [Plasmodium falciparum MaliPS096_E11]|uniref:Ribosome biogenesis protein TSR1 n=1 Tax=Plasmodium falciparum MaliPS096_E11 TaxID=1036727 RepID=A0A024WHJ5_PLAFA|nr:hypothetical protein PFMALIP_05349 [Plasmodium falciparum MaliPS096_E11]